MPSPARRLTLVVSETQPVGAKVALTQQELESRLWSAANSLRGPVDPADRGYWEKRGSKQTLAMADEMLAWLHGLDPGLEPSYNRFYIGLAKHGCPNNFVSGPRRIRSGWRSNSNDQTRHRLCSMSRDSTSWTAKIAGAGTGFAWGRPI
jgi:hypothetical protein